MRRRWQYPLTRAAVALAVSTGLLATGACVLNPATGKRQLALIGEGQEVAMGRDAHDDIVASFGTYDLERLQATVSRVGQKLAALSERPDLPWTFEVLDDPVVNAFALPGGYIYVTRGILAHFESEAELAAVLGHEIGHVTARHSVNQMSKAQLAGIGLGVGVLVEPELARFSDVTETALGLMFLKFSRDDERQADDLGLRYMSRAGYAPEAMVGVFEMLHAVSEAGGGGRTPGWLATHPAPENRSTLIRAAIQERGLDPDAGTVARESYLRDLDSMIYGQNPREGFFRDDTFYHPDMAFRLDFPGGWRTSNQRTRVAALSPSEDAAMQLTLASQASPSAAADAFFADDQIRRGSSWRGDINGLPASSASFSVVSTSGSLAGLAVFVELGGRVFRLLGYAASRRWPEHRPAVESALGSFQRLTDRSIRDIQPRRLQVVTLSAPQSLAEFDRQQGATIPVEELALINRTEPGTRLPAGRLIKRVVGGP